MTEEEAKSASEASHAAARADYMHRTSRLTWRDPDNDTQPNAITLVREMLENSILALRQNQLDDPLAAVGSDLATALSTPTGYDWCEYTTESESDPLSGNPRPKTVIRHESADIALLLLTIRQLFVTYALALTDFARRNSSPTYLPLRDVVLEICEQRDAVRFAAIFDQEFVAKTLSRLKHLTFELKVDMEIVRMGQEEEVRHG